MEVVNSSNTTTYENVKTTQDEEISNDQFRFVNKTGHINVNYSSIERIKNMHSNIILFIMQAKWWFVLTLVLFGFIFSWFFFALLYYLVSIEHGDFSINADDLTLLDNQTNSTRQFIKIEQEKCVQDVHNFLSALLFSIETQHTIGYGSRYITTECMGGILVLTLQCSLGYLLQVIVTQIMFTKLSRPTEKSQFVVFSHHALIVPRNNQLTLTFRIGNLSVSQLIFASVRLLMIRQRRTIENEIIPHQIYDMELTHLRNGQLFFPRPTVVEHIIDSRSPLYGIQRSTLSNDHFEIIAIIEGSFDHTGFSCHFRTSYLPDELLWGYQFSSCDSTVAGFDYQKFNHIKLINANPLWNYDEEENTDETNPNSPNMSPYIGRKHIIKKNSSFDDKRHFRLLETIKSIPNELCENITTMESIDTDNEEQDITEKIPFIKENVQFE